MVGDEKNVLSRYVNCVKQTKSDYIIRLTADCPDIPAPLISHMIFSATNNKLDYKSNVWEQCRTHPDGFDVEVISDRAIRWLAEVAEKPEHLEHVTLMLRENTPDWLKVGHCVGYIDASSLKTSVDTQEDLEFSTYNIDSMQKKIDFAKNRGCVLSRF